MLNKKIVFSVLVLAILAMPGLAADNSSSFLTPGMGMAWYNRQGQEFKDLMWDVVGALVFITGLVFICSELIAGTKGKVATAFSNSKEKSHFDTAALKIAGYLFIVMAAIYFGLRLFKWF